MSVEENKEKRKILLVAATTSQAELFVPVIRELPDWDVLAVSITRNREKRAAIETVFQRQHIAGITMRIPGKARSRQIIREAEPDIVYRVSCACHCLSYCWDWRGWSFSYNIYGTQPEI